MVERGHSKVLLVANPAHATDSEHAFWCEVAAAARRRGWLLLEMSARRTPPTPDGQTVVIPARLWELAERMRKLESAGLQDDVAWLDHARLTLLEDWERRRWELGAPEPRVRPGLLRLAHYIDTAVRSVRPAVVMTTNKIDHGVAFPRWAGKHHGCRTLLVERSPFDGIWLEADGIFGESGIRTAYESAQHEIGRAEIEAGERVIKAMAGNPYGFRRQEANRTSPAGVLRDTTRPLFFLPMDNVLWTGWAQPDHPQRAVDYPMYGSPREAIEQLHRHVHAIGGTLVVKSHPSCRHFRPEAIPPGVLYCDQDLGDLLLAADVVLTFNTKVAFVGLALAKPVVTLALNPAAVSGATYHCVDERGILATLQAALREGLTPVRRQSFVRFCGWLARHYFYECSDRERFTDRGPESLVTALVEEAEARHGRTLSTPPLDAIANLELLAAGSRKASYAFPATHVPQELGVTRPRPPRRLVVFDANRLAEEHIRHSGISRYAREMLRRLASRPDLELDAVVTRSRRSGANDVAHRIRADTGVTPRYASGSEPLFRVSGTGNGDPRIYHTPCGPLPPVQLTGDAVRIVTIHDCLHIKYPELYPLPGHVPAIERTLDSIDVLRDFVICDSEATRQDLLSLLSIEAERVVVIPLAAEPTYFAPDFQRMANRLRVAGIRPRSYFAALCQVDPRKNISMLVRALAELDQAAAFGDYHAVLVSRSAEAGVLEREIERAGLSGDRVRIVTDLDDGEMAALYSGAAFSVHIPLYEGFGLPPLESMAAGCPPVVSSTSSLPEVVGDAGIYVDPTNLASVVNGIRVAIGSPTLIADLSRRAGSRAAQFSWDRTAAATVEFYEYCCGRAPDARAISRPTIRQAALPPAVEPPVGRDLLRRAKDWGRRLGAWYATPSGAVYLAWLAAIGWAFAGLPGWQVARVLALAGAVALIPYLSVRAKKDAEEMDRGTRRTVRNEMRQAAKLGEARWAERLAAESRRWAERLAAESRRNERASRAIQSSRQGLEAKLGSLREETLRRIRAERSQHILMAARRNARLLQPRCCLIIVSANRTGSTWLLDALRCHPRIIFLPTAEIWLGLGLDGMNRYPAGLSGGPDATMEFEIQPGRGELVPSYELPVEIAAAVAKSMLQEHAIEKLHPEFFDWDAGAFSDRVKNFARTTGREIRVLYRVRDPKDAIRSMISYKRRDPSWYAEVGEAEVPGFFARTLRCLAELRVLLPGLVADYSEQTVDATSSLVRAFDWIWPDSDQRMHQLVAAAATELTTLARRRDANETTFFAKDGFDATAHGEPQESLSPEFAKDLASCYEAHAALIAKASG